MVKSKGRVDTDGEAKRQRKGQRRDSIPTVPFQWETGSKMENNQPVRTYLTT